MLKIWYYANIEYMKDAPSYFDNVYEDEWIEDSFVKEMIQDVDHCTVISSHVLDSPILGAITPRELSGGVKVLILMLKDDSFIYNMHAFKNSNVTSSNGNGNLIKCVKELGVGDTLVIVDGAAFGSLIETCISSFQIQTERRISLWLPESFEYLILKSGILKSEKLTQILDNIPEYVECEKYESWENFFTKLLIMLTADGIEKYSKNMLNSYYLQDWVVDKIKEQLPIEVINK